MRKIKQLVRNMVSNKHYIGFTLEKLGNKEVKDE